MQAILEKIRKQSKLWLIFGWVTPFLFLLAATSIYGITHAAVPFVLYTSWAFFIAVSLIWWAWVIKVIHEMTTMFTTMLHLVKMINREVNSVHQDLKLLDNDSNK